MLFFSLFLGVILNILHYSSQLNLIRNPSFEVLNVQKWTPEWIDDRHKCKIVNDTAHTGNNSVYCNGGKSGVYQFRWGMVKGVKYRLKGWVKTKNITGGKVLFSVESSNSYYGCYRYHDIGGCQNGTCDGKWYELICNSIMNFGPAGFYIISIDLRPATATGEFWFDDVSMEVIETDVLLGTDVVTWRQEIFEAPVDVLVDLDIMNSIFVNGDYLIITVDIKDQETGKVVDTLTEWKLETREENRVAVFNWNPKPLKQNRFYTVRAKTVNTIFSNRTENVTTTVKKLNESRIYNFYVDKYMKAWDHGKKFFPLGLYVQGVQDSDLELFKDSPFNLIKLPGVNRRSNSNNKRI